MSSAMMTSPPRLPRVMGARLILRPLAIQKCPLHKSIPNTIPKHLELQQCETISGHLLVRGHVCLGLIDCCTWGITFGLYNYSTGTTQTSTLHMQHRLHRALTSLALVRRVITRWPQVQWVTKTPTHQPATTQHHHPWHTRYFIFVVFFFS